MKYDFEIEMETKEAIVPLFLRIPAPLAREFKFVVKGAKRSMNYVITDMIRQFLSEYHRKGQPKQKEMF